MTRRSLLIFGSALALSFTVGWLVAHFGALPNPPKKLVIAGIRKDSVDAERYIKGKIDIGQLDYLSPTDAVTFCKIDGFSLTSATESIEEVEVDLGETSAEKMNCIFDVAREASERREKTPELRAYLPRQEVSFQMRDHR